MPQNNPFNFFYYAEKSTEKEFIEQVNRTDSKILDTALSTLQMREMLLPLILRYQSATAFSAFLEKVSPDVLVKAMDYKDKLFYSPLMYAAGYQDSKGFIALLNKVPSASINATLPQVSDVRREGVPLQSCAASSTVLHIAAELQPAEGFKKLLEKITIHLDSLIPLVNEEGWTFLHIAAKYQSGENFIKLLYPQYISESALDEAVLRKTPGGKTPLHLAARYQSHATIHHMLNIVGLGVIFKLVENNKDDFDEIRLLLSDAFFVYRVQDQYKSVLYDTILKYFTPLPVLTRLLNLIWIRIQQGDVLLPSLSIRKKIIEALVTPERLLGVKKRAFFQYLKKNTPDVNEGEWLSARVAQHIEARKSVETLPPEYILALTQAAEDIPESRILPACEAPAHIVEKITHNKTLIKIVPDERYEIFITQLKNYQYRPKIRKPVSASLHSGRYKYIHKTGDTVSYSVHDEKDKRYKPTYTHTKKTSTTMPNAALKTPVFNHHRENKILVGYLFELDKCITKALLSRDKGTILTQWISYSQAGAEQGARLVPNYNYTDKEAFFKAVNAATGITNEPLAKLSRDSLLAILVARKDYEAIKIAEHRQMQMFMDLGINLPILFYDSRRGDIEMVKDIIADVQSSPSLCKIT